MNGASSGRTETTSASASPLLGPAIAPRARRPLALSDAEPVAPFFSREPAAVERTSTPAPEEAPRDPAPDATVSAGTPEAQAAPEEELPWLALEDLIRDAPDPAAPVGSESGEASWNEWMETALEEASSESASQEDRAVQPVDATVALPELAPADVEESPASIAPATALNAPPAPGATGEGDAGTGSAAAERPKPPLFAEVADRLERIAQTLRRRAPADLSEDDDEPDPLQMLITGYALGYSEALRSAASKRRDNGQ